MYDAADRSTERAVRLLTLLDPFKMQLWRAVCDAQNLKMNKKTTYPRSTVRVRVADDLKLTPHWLRGDNNDDGEMVSMKRSGRCATEPGGGDIDFAAERSLN